MRRAGGDGLVILRSPGKFYGLAGPASGVCHHGGGGGRRLSENLGPWAVAGPALQVGAAALGDRDWQQSMRGWLADQTAALDAVLNDAGLTVLGGTTLFRLVGAPDAGAMFERLVRAGILVRPFSYAPTWLRLGLPADSDGLARLAEALENDPRGR